MKKTVRSVMTVLLLVIVWICPVRAENVPTKITSETMKYAGEADSVVFSGKVHVQRETFELWSNMLTVDLAPSPDTGKASADAGTPGQGDIRKITALGAVRILSQGKEGFCGKAVYFADSGMVRMEQDPVLKDGPNEIRGEVIKLYMRENRSEVVGGKKRVEAVFYTPAEKSEVP